MLKLRKYFLYNFLNNDSFHSLHHVSTLAETEHVSLSHLQLAQGMREEAKKLEEFREKQKEARKKVCGVTHGHRDAASALLLTRRHVVISDGAADGCFPQTEVFTFQEDDGCKSKLKCKNNYYKNKLLHGPFSTVHLNNFLFLVMHY